MVLTINKMDDPLVIPLAKDLVYLLSRATVDHLGEVALGHGCFQATRRTFSTAQNLYQHEQTKCQGRIFKGWKSMLEIHPYIIRVYKA